MKRAMVTLAGVAMIALLVVGCGTESGTKPVQSATVGLKVVFDLTPPTPNVPGGDGAQKNSGPSGVDADSVTVNSGLLMIRSIRLSADGVADVDTVITAADEDRDLLDAGVRFHGPYVMQISGAGQSLGETVIPVGVYEQATFVLQKARSTDDLGDHSDLVGSSMRITGNVWYAGDAYPFTFETDYTSEFVIDGPLTVNSGSGNNLELTFAAGSWFHNGSRWLDPRKASNRLQILRGLRRNVSGGLDIL